MDSMIDSLFDSLNIKIECYILCFLLLRTCCEPVANLLRTCCESAPNMYESFLRLPPIFAKLPLLESLIVDLLFLGLLLFVSSKIVSYLLRQNTLSKLMKAEFPQAKFSYALMGFKGSSIVRKKKWFRKLANRREYDAIKGKLGEIEFRLSRICLKTRRSRVDFSLHKTLDGHLFQFKLPETVFPNTYIKISLGFRERLKGDFIKHKRFRFWYKTDRPEDFDSAFDLLLPWINFLQHAKGFFRVAANGNEVLLFVETDDELIYHGSKQLMAAELRCYLHILDCWDQGLSREEMEKEFESLVKEYRRKYGD